LLTFGAAATCALSGNGPFFEPSIQHSLISLQAYGIVSSLATLIVASLAREREKMTAALADSLERFQQLTTLSSDRYWEQDENLRYTSVAGRAVEGLRVREED
jgi:PAS domain-containing protein